MNLRIAEIFSSIQGEGIWSGVPSTFVRVSGCNLRCRWCDTPYASWQPEGPIMSLDEIEREVVRLGTRHVVLTGGEPMLFEAIVPLAARLKDKGHTITIETAGTRYLAVTCDLMSISPKLASSAPDADSGWQEKHEADRRHPEVVKKLMAEYPYQLKFVIDPDNPNDLQEIEACVRELKPDPAKVLLMPEGVDAATLDDKQKKLVPICMERGWRLCPRLHIQLFGDKRGT